MPEYPVRKQFLKLFKVFTPAADKAGGRRRPRIRAPRRMPERSARRCATQVGEEPKLAQQTNSNSYPVHQYEGPDAWASGWEIENQAPSFETRPARPLANDGGDTNA